MKAPRPRAIVCHPSFGDFAGAELVGAWVLQTLRESHEPSLWCYRRPDWARVDARFGTTLRSAPPAVFTPPPFTRRLRHLPAGRRLALAFCRRQLGELHRRLAPALWLGTYNELWLPAPGWLYLHHPERAHVATIPADWPAPRRFAHRLVERACHAIAHDSTPSISAHRVLANSAWTARTYSALGGQTDSVLTPPVPPFAPGLPWAEREDRVLVIGRWHPDKRLEAAISTIALARVAGADLRLTFAGFWHGPEEHRRRLLELSAPHPWIDWVENPSRPELEALAGRCRYGLHAAINEHFGIAVVELASAGCIVLAHSSGGPVLTLREPRQLYHDESHAAALLLDLTSSAPLQAELHAAARPLALRHAPEHFQSALRAHLGLAPT